MKIIQHDHLPIKIYETTLTNGMKVVFLPRPGLQTTKVVLHVKFGLKDESQPLQFEENWRALPQGTAHFLEHRIFESKGEHLMRHFAKHGANINASTGTTATQYYFSTVRDFPELIDYFLNFIQQYEDTDDGVKKEAGIIHREYVRRYESQSSQIEKMMFEVTYPDHHLARAILGTETTILGMKKEDLALAYAHYYRPANLTLAITGNVDVDSALATIDAIEQKISSRPPLPTQVLVETQPIDGKTFYHEKMFNITIPENHFYLKFAPFKQTMPYLERYRKGVVFGFVRKLILNSNAPLYLSWKQKGLLSSTLSGTYYHQEDSYAVWIYEAHTDQPKAFFEELKSLFTHPWDDAVMEPLFQGMLNSMIGGAYQAINRLGDLTNQIIDHASANEPYLINLSMLPTITYAEVKAMYEEPIQYDLHYFHVIPK